VIYPTERVITIVPILFIPLFIPVPAILFALIWFALQVWQGTTEIGHPAMAAGIAWWAHIGGFGFGAVFALVVRLVSSGPQTRVARWSEMYERSARGRRVPDVSPREW
jgi:membrane associated rhomboid family serine protease